MARVNSRYNGFCLFDDIGQILIRALFHHQVHTAVHQFLKCIRNLIGSSIRIVQHVLGLIQSIYEVLPCVREEIPFQREQHAQIVIQVLQQVLVHFVDHDVVRIAAVGRIHLISVQDELAVVVLALVGVAGILRQIARDHIAHAFARRDHHGCVCIASPIVRACIIRVQVDIRNLRPGTGVRVVSIIIDKHLEGFLQAVVTCLRLALGDGEAILGQSRLSVCTAFAQFQGNLHLGGQGAVVCDDDRLKVGRNRIGIIARVYARGVVLRDVVGPFVRTIARQFRVEIFKLHRAEIIKG